MSANAITGHPQTAAELRDCLARLRAAAPELARVPLAHLLDHLNALGQLWRPDAPYFRQARELLAGTFSPVALDAALHGLGLALDARVLEAELNRELGRADLLDAWQPDELGVGHVRGFPLGVTAHVLAGNVFLGGAVALAQSLLTRNAVLVKLSRADTGFTELFARSLLEAAGDDLLGRCVAIARWDSAHEELNQVLRDEADGLVVWGGQAAVDAYPAERCRGRVIHYGPRLGVGFVLAGVNLDLVLPELAWDVALWEQQACSSPRVLFVEAGGGLPAQVARGLSQALRSAGRRLTPRALSLDDKAEVLALRELAYWQQGARLFAAPDAMDHTVLLTDAPPADVPLGYRTVVVVPLAGLDGLEVLLQPYRAGLQTAVLAAPPGRWPAAAEALARAGFTQIAAAGSAAARFLGLPHEGEYALRRLVRLVGIDLGVGPLVAPDRDAAASAAIASALLPGAG